MPDKLYHCSPEFITGEIVPYHSKKLTTLNGGVITSVVHASSNLEISIAAAMLKLYQPHNIKGKFFTPHLKTRGDSPYLILFDGEITNDRLYLYELPTQEFIQLGRENDWYIGTPIQPLNKQEIQIDDYRHLIKHATKFDFLAKAAQTLAK
jgi:hypothetical protein